MNEQQIIMLPTEDSTPSSKEGSGFEICSFYRECSNAMKCIQPAGVECHLCKYAQKLKEGICFYGKNSIHFDASRYASFCDRINELSEEEKKVFDTFVITLNNNKKFFWQRVHTSPLYYHLEKMKVMETTEAARLLLNNHNVYKITDLRKMVTDRFTEEERKEKGLKLNKREPIVQFITNNCPDIIKNINDTYVYVTIPRDYVDCYTEYYYDYLAESSV